MFTRVLTLLKTEAHNSFPEIICIGEHIKLVINRLIEKAQRFLCAADLNQPASVSIAIQN
jgi:hypothetical protein